MTERLGEWIMRSGEELKLQLPPFDAAPRFRDTLELRREGPHLAIRGVHGDFIRWGVKIDLPYPGREVRPMPDAEFNALLTEGALAHPRGGILTRAHLALFSLMQTVPGATEALRRWASERDQQDQAAGGKSAAMEEDVPQ